MREAYLCGISGGNYLFAEGKARGHTKPYHDIKRRAEWSSDDLCSKLRETLNPKRKTQLHLEFVPEELAEEIEKLFFDTKVVVSIN